jgi:hypothetical protein
MNGRPSDVIDVIAVVLERVKRPVLLQAPELDGPIDGRREEEVAKVNGAEAVVGAQPCHWGTLVSLEVI